MIRGLVIGKFLPVHNGHLALIDFASTQCDELIVSMSFRPDDPIDPELRFSWLRQLLSRKPGIEVKMIADDFDNESLDWPERTKIWANVIRKVYPPVDLLISSERYGEYFARHLEAGNILYDLAREYVPVSASRIRENPLKYWDFIPSIVQPYFVKKVCFYGPESTGKSVMAEGMAEKYNTVFVPEVAREFLSTNDFTVSDIIKIGCAHYERIIEKSKVAKKILFVDTDAITTQIYSRHYLGISPNVLHELEGKVTYDHYFLFDIDIPWVSDGLRDLGNKRKEMFDLFRKNLEDRNIRYSLVTGNWNERECIIREKLHSIFGL